MMRGGLVVTLALGLAMAACSGEGSSEDADSPSPPAGRAKGSEVLAGDYSSGGYTLRFLDDQWAQLRETAPGQFEVGTRGTYRIEDGRLYLTEVGGAADGNVFTFRFSVEGSTLSLRFEDPERVESMDRVVFEHDWERVE